MPKNAVIFVPYRSIAQYERRGPCVRDWAIMEIAFGICHDLGLPMYVIDRPNFKPWENIFSPVQPLNRIKQHVSEKQIFHSTIVPPCATLINGRRASAPILERAIKKIAKCHKNLLVMDFDPFSIINLPGNTTHWFDEIDDFALHPKMPARDRLAFTAKRFHGHAIHTASSLESKYGEPMPNWSFTPVGLDSNEGEHPYRFGYIGFIDSKIDLNFVQRLAERGRVGFWGKVLDRRTKKSLSAIPNVFLFGEFNPSETGKIISKFEVGIIPFIPDRIHGNSPIKYYHYSAARKICVSTCSFGLSRENLIVIDSHGLNRKIDQLPKLNYSTWESLDERNNEGKVLFYNRILTEIKRLGDI